MMWLFLQIFLYCLLSFLLGVLVTWFFLVRPRTRQGPATGAPAGDPEESAAAGSAVMESTDAEPVPADPDAGGSGNLTPGGVADRDAVGAAATTDESGSRQARGDASAPDEAAADRSRDADATATPPVTASVPADDAAPAAGAVPAAPVPTAIAEPATGAGTSVEPFGAATATAVAEPGPYGEGSVRALPDGSAPSDDYTIKGNADSMLYHTTRSPYFRRTKAEVWFRTESDAERGGFTAWNRRRKRSGT